MIGWRFLSFYVTASIHVGFGYRQLVDSRTTIASQSSTLNNYGADRAIDGYPWLLSMNSRSCSHTGGGQSEAWLRIDLRKVYNIKSVKFWYRTDRSNFLENTERLHGYSLRYSTDKWNICYQDRTPVNQAIPMPSTVECPHKTRYLLFYTVTPAVNDKEQVFLEICEIEVYGCEINQYGENCTDCVDRCVSCHIIYGCVQCQPRFTGKYCEDCEPGFFGQSCDPCARGWYGSNCSMQCSGNCYNEETCHNVNGSCWNGCKPGYRGYRCSQQCENETYGLNCQKKCSGHCFEKETCDNVDGSCTKGCEKGWEGSQCSNACKIGTYGEDCKYNCSGNCYEDMPCDRFNGTCSNGCDVGWSGSMCEKKCSQGKYGFQCNNTCNTCKNAICHHINGSCSLGCADGWTGDLCDEGMYSCNCYFTKTNQSILMNQLCK